MIQEVYEKTAPPDRLRDPRVLAYLRGLTVVWIVYFVAKAALYAWFAVALTLPQAMALRSVIGIASMAALLGGETLLRKKIFELA